MQAEFYDEWRRLEEEATKLLKTPSSRDALLPECHGVLLPSLDDCRAYTLMVPSLTAPGPPLGVKRVWRRRTDLAKFEPLSRLRYGPNLHPTIEEHEVRLERELVEGILKKAASINVPAYVRERTFGVDGERYFLCFGSCFLSSHFQWWGNPPAEWVALELLLQEVARVIDGGLTGT